MTEIKKKVLFFCAFPNQKRGFTGANIGTKVTYELLKDEFDITPFDIGMDHFKPESLNWKHIKYNINISFHYLIKLRELKKELKNNKYDYLYFLPASSVKGHFRDVALIATARRHVEKIIGHNRNGNFYAIYDRKWHRQFTNFFLRYVSKFIFLSDNLRATTKHFIEASKTAVAFNPIDKEIQCTATEIADKITSRHGRKTLEILYLSNMIPSKGYKDLASAAVLLKERGFTDFRINFIGRWNTSSDEKEMLDFADTNNISQLVQFSGKVSDRAIIKEQLLKADLFVLPTYYPVEAQPRSIIEAMNAATPIISTRHASIPEMFDHTVEGLLVDVKCPHQLADAIMKFTDYHEWARFANNAYKKFDEKFSDKAVLHQLIKAFRE